MQQLPRRFQHHGISLQALNAAFSLSIEPRASGVFVCLLVLLASFAAHAQGDARRGEYLVKAAGCAGCHTDTGSGAVAYAGGRILDTPFGNFYGPNITPHPQAGIGRWSEQDFFRAMRQGVRPDGAHYYPAFPYPSFTQIADQDLRDLWAYLRSLPPSPRATRPHELRFPFGWRWLITVWKFFFFSPGAFQPDPGRNAVLNRGAYLIHALGHCGECHTPRNFLGGQKKGRALAGGKLPEGRVPNLTPTGLKKWNDGQLKDFLRTGATPEGDTTSDVMYEVVRNTTSQLTAQDLDALVAYLRSLPPLPDEPK
jgi:mono/diheme cytochrome c family protein